MPRPNVLWIMADQFNARCMSFLGSQARTPNLDALAADGVSFDRAYANNPICAPSRICFLTGQYLHTHGLQGNRVCTWADGNPDSLAALFRRSGWRTGLFGKAHMPRIWNEEGFERLAYTDLADADPADPTTCHYFRRLDERGLAGWYEEGTARPGSPGHLDGSAAADLPYEHSIEHFTGNETLRFLENGDDERPFFIQMSFQRPHAPIRPAAEHFDLYDPDDIELPDSAVDWFERGFAGKPEHLVEALRGGSTYPLADEPATLRRVLASYYALITCIDMEVGRVLDRLRETGQYDNTIVIFTADHGDFAGEHGLFHKNFGIYESIQRIPFILRTPDGPRGQRRRQIIESVDLYPTLCELCGLEAPDDVEGVSVMSVVKNADAAGKAEALCEWSWFGDPPRINALRTDRYRLVYYNHSADGELYDHETDPGEIDNLWNEPDHAAVRWDLLTRLFDRVNSYRAPLEMRDDKVIADRHRFMPAQVVQFGRADWDRLREACGPTPVRDPIEED